MNAATTINLPIGADQPIHGSGSYRAWAIGGEGGGLVDMAWFSRVEHGKPEAHRLLPFVEPSVSLIRRFDKSGNTISFDISVCSAMPDGGAYVPEPGEEQFALRLVPERLERVFGNQGASLIKDEGRLPSWFADTLDIARRLAERGHFERAWQAMAQACRTPSANLCQRADRVSHAARLARASNGRFDPSELASLADISPRHLRRCFVERFGISPRGISRRLRLTAALIEAESQKAPRWADIAAGHGFSDQAHMIRECRAIMGESPGELHKLRQPMAVSFNT